LDIYTTTIGLSLVVYIVVGNYAGHGIRRLDDYYVAGRRAPTFLIVGTLVASLMSSVVFLGEAGFAYAGQVGPYVLFPQIACAGYVIGAIFFGRYLRRSRARTVAAFFGERFASRRVQAMAGATIVLALGGYLMAVTQGAAILLSELTPLTYAPAVIVAWLSYTIFTIYSGSRGVMLTDTLMFLVFSLASLAAIVYLIAAFGGPVQAVEDLVGIDGKPGLMSWHGVIGAGTDWPTARDYLTWGLAIDASWLLVYAVSPWQSSRHLMARNEHVVLRAACIACVVTALLQVMIYGMGGLVNLGNPDIVPQESAVIWASLNLLPPALGALLLAGIMAAALSSASTFLSLVGFSATNDLGIHDADDDARTLRFSRWLMLAVGCLALAATLVFPPDIFWLMIFIGTVFASSWGPVAFMSIWSRRITESGAFWGMLAGLVFNVGPKFLEFIGLFDFPYWLDPVIIGVVSSCVVTYLVSSRGRVSREEADYLTRLHQTPVDDVSDREARVSMRAASLLVFLGLSMPFVLLRWYVRPYQSATGTLAADGSLDLLTGEALLAMSWGVVYVFVGWLAARVIRRDYVPLPQARSPRLS